MTKEKYFHNKETGEILTFHVVQTPSKFHVRKVVYTPNGNTLMINGKGYGVSQTDLKSFDRKEDAEAYRLNLEEQEQ